MKFIKNFNNNAALVSDKSGVDWVVIGNGIGFGKKTDDLVDETKITRRFVAVEKNMELIDSVSDIDTRTLSLTTQVIKIASDRLQVKFSDYQYLALADHIDFMLKRNDNQVELGQSTASWEIRKLFPKEFAAAEKALHLIEKKSDQDFSSDEAVYLAYHFINASSSQAQLQDTIKITKLIRGVVEIVEYQYGMQLDNQTFNFNRFITHLRAFMIRHVVHAEETGSELDDALLELIKAKYAKAYQTVLKIGTYLSKEAGWKLQPDDEVYLTLHVWRVTHRAASSQAAK